MCRSISPRTVNNEPKARNSQGARFRLRIKRSIRIFHTRPARCGCSPRSVRPSRTPAEVGIVGRSSISGLLVSVDGRRDALDRQAIGTQAASTELEVSIFVGVPRTRTTTSPHARTNSAETTDAISWSLFAMNQDLSRARTTARGASALTTSAASIKTNSG